MSLWGPGRKLRSPDLQFRALFPFAELRRMAWRSSSRRGKNCARAGVARGAGEALPSQIESSHRRLPLRTLFCHTPRTLQVPPPLVTLSTCPRPPPKRRFPPLPRPLPLWPIAAQGFGAPVRLTASKGRRSLSSRGVPPPPGPLICLRSTFSRA